MSQELTRLCEALLSSTQSDQLLTISEGFVKVRCAEAALSFGWVLQEGVGGASKADFLRLDGGTIIWERGSRRLQLSEGGSSDLAVVEPFQMLLEIKARPDLGTKSQAQFQEMDADVRRIARHQNCAFLFIFDEKIYRSFSGEKREARGRKAVAADWFLKSFPPLASLTAIRPTGVTANRDGAELLITFWRQDLLSGRTRVFVSGHRSDALF